MYYRTRKHKLSTRQLYQAPTREKYSSHFHKTILPQLPNSRNNPSNSIKMQITHYRYTDALPAYSGFLYVTKPKVYYNYTIILGPKD